MSFQAMIKPAQPAQNQLHCWGDRRFSRHAVGLSVLDLLSQRKQLLLLQAPLDRQWRQNGCEQCLMSGRWQGLATCASAPSELLHGPGVQWLFLHDLGMTWSCAFARALSSPESLGTSLGIQLGCWDVRSIHLICWTHRSGSADDTSIFSLIFPSGTCIACCKLCNCHFSSKLGCFLHAQGYPASLQAAYGGS